MTAEASVAAVLRHCEAREKIASDNGGLIAIAYTSDIRAALNTQIEAADTIRQAQAEAWNDAAEAYVNWSPSTPSGIPIDPPLNPYEES